MKYRVIFDATTQLPDIRFTVIGVVLIVVGLAFVYLSRVEPPPIVVQRMFRTEPGLIRWFAAVFLGFNIFWTCLATATVLLPYLRTRRAMREGHIATVEGVVEDFHPMPYSGHDTERFVVRGVQFSYSDYISSSAFNQKSSHGGPIREGLRVRIEYMGDSRAAEIVKLEIAEEP